MENGFQGKEGQQMPDMPDEFVDQISNRYIELYERVTGNEFIPAATNDIASRIAGNVKSFL